jgi:hypothetical protein
MQWFDWRSAATTHGRAHVEVEASRNMVRWKRAWTCRGGSEHEHVEVGAGMVQRLPTSSSGPALPGPTSRVDSSVRTLVVRVPADT